MMMGLPRTNCWILAEYAGEACPRGMQRLLSSAFWDADKVLDDVRDWTLTHLGDDQAILVIAETGDLKKGTSSVGVQRQHRHRWEDRELPGRRLPDLRCSHPTRRR
jgi:SRSO17 transposase